MSTKIGNKFRESIGTGKNRIYSKPFSTRALARAWKRRIQGEQEEMAASGFMNPHGTTVANLLTRYTEEFFPREQWSISKESDLARLGRESLGARPAGSLNQATVVDYFTELSNNGTGPVGVNALVSYLAKLFKIARSSWHLNVPLQAVLDARQALKDTGRAGQANERSQRVNDAQLAAILQDVKARPSPIPMSEIVEFCVASAMRIGEVCRITWADLNEQDKTVIIRKRKHPTDRASNDQEVPLLDVTGYDAFAIAMRQPRISDRIFPYDSKSVGKSFAKSILRLKLGDIHLHDLRHEAISRVVESRRYQIPEVAIVSGHKSWSQLKRYTNLKAVDLHRLPQVEARPAKITRARTPSRKKDAIKLGRSPRKAALILRPHLS